ncbi:NADPH:adrenodoxin oxidoreductase [Achlya hypogyna]|uniref:NADPH:adrenodoxin oxidoreductase, mitochondrial n=1 Tax=Achlya hypogyna TaxID=1202772 RepID=A0A1V9YDK9_ACHHY|nr:NADPH:adrenodoxin oxidoreductase [Achlya hypogyna]
MLGLLRTSARRPQWLATRAMSTETDNLKRVCIVGSGPAGFYTAKYLLKEHSGVHVDMLEALPTPYGLVRSGVAPDHPEVKNVMNDFNEVASDPRFTFLGNVNVGSDVSVPELQEHYNAVVLASGATDDRKLNVPGENLTGVMAARSFVNWYNGHPAFRDLDVPLDSDTAVVIGQGNVAVDCARILSKSPAELSSTDISAHALDALAKGGIKKVVLVGRRGCAQAAFTMKELREITRLEDAACVMNPAELNSGLNPASLKEIEETRSQKRMYQLLSTEFPLQILPISPVCTVAKDYTANAQSSRQIQIRFLLSPVEFLPDAKDPTRVGAIKVEVNQLSGEAFAQKASGTGEFEVIPCGLVLRSIGYKSTPLEHVPFDTKRNVLSNVAGRIVEPATQAVVRGLYCAGWVKRGPSGIIGTNINDARETVASLLADVAELPAATKDATALHEALRAKKRVVSWLDYGRIEAAEAAAGAAVGKPREKFTSVAAMLDTLQ